MINPPTYDFVKGSHCSWCGSRFAEQIVWPRKCFRCNNESYANPLPVVVALIAVYHREDPFQEASVLIQQRNIEPQKGKWALPSGYINLGETWQEACAREVKEEMGLITFPEDYQFFDAAMGSSNNTLCLFADHKYGVYWDEINFVPNVEVQSMEGVSKPEELAFPTHTLYLSNFLKLL
jgi:8-oxo-dGTP pyrophosphatase MutT (NUDIX family)